MPDSEATLATQVYRRLRSDLLEGRLPPGGKLKVQSIAADYGVGASPIREALSSLAAEGLVERLDQRGFRAPAASLDDYEELVRARCWLEEIVLGQSIAAGGPAWEEGVVLANYRLGRLARAGASAADAEWNDAIEAYYDALLSACPSTTLLGFCTATREKVSRYRHLAGAASPEPIAALPEFETITATALARRGEEAARLLVDQHMATARRLGVALGKDEPAGAA